MGSMDGRNLNRLTLAFPILVAAVLVASGRSVDGYLSIEPSGDELFAPAGLKFSIICRKNDHSVSFNDMKWLGPDGKTLSQGSFEVKKIDQNALQLSFLNPTVNESGIYKCTATNEDNQYLEYQTKIKFSSDAPVFETKFENVTVEEGSFVQLTCAAFGESPIVYEWYDEYEDKITGNESTRIHVSSFTNYSALTIREVHPDDDGFYMCTASNMHGLESKTFVLTVLKNPGNKSLDVQIAKVTETSVYFIIQHSRNVSVITAIYGEIKRPNSSAPLTSSVNWSPGYIYEVVGLTPGGRYHFRFQSDDYKTDIYEIVLLPSVPEVIFNVVDKGMIQLQWLRTFDDIMRETIDHYELSYNTVQMVGGNSWKESNCAVTITIPQCSSGRYTIAKLGLNVYYQIRLRAHTKGGYGKYFTQKIYMSDRN